MWLLRDFYIDFLLTGMSEDQPPDGFRDPVGGIRNPDSDEMENSGDELSSRESSAEQEFVNIIKMFLSLLIEDNRAQGCE